MITLMTILNESAIYMAGGGLGGLKDTIINQWLGPLFLIAVAAFALIFIKDRAWMKLIGFVGIAAIVGVLIFAGESMFGKSGGLKKVAETTGKQIGTGQ